VVLVCVVNLSEGRDPDLVAALAGVAGADLLDVHRDPDHHRCVLTLAGTDAPRAVAVEAVARLDLRIHTGVHPRIGVVDVVPFVPVGGTDLTEAVAARGAFAHWAGITLDLPCFLYGPERSLPEVRRGAFRNLAPDTGPPDPHPTAGGCAVGARGPLVAYNVFLDSDDVALARSVAIRMRSPQVRALGLAVGGRAQVSMNLVAPLEVGPAVVVDQIAALAPVAATELVGLLPEGVLAQIDPHRWEELDVAPDRTVEHRLAAAGR